MNQREYDEAIDHCGQGAVEIIHVDVAQADREGLPCGYCMGDPEADTVRIRAKAHERCLESVRVYFAELERDREQRGGVL